MSTYKYKFICLIKWHLNLTQSLMFSIQGHLNLIQSLMFLKVNVNKSFTQRYQVKKVGDTLLDMIQEED